MKKLFYYTSDTLAILSHRHQNAAKYYRRCAFITTEASLVETFLQLSTERDQFAKEIRAAIGSEAYDRPDVDVAMAHMGKIWRSMKAALIINGRQRIIKNVLETERAALKRTRKLLAARDVPTTVRGLLQGQAQHLELSVEQLAGMGKKRRPKRARAA